MSEITTDPKLCHVQGFGYVAGHRANTFLKMASLAIAYEPNGASGGVSVRVPLSVEEGLALIRALTEAIAHVDQKGEALERAGQQRLALLMEREGTPLTDAELQS